MRSKLGNTLHFTHSLLLVPLVSALFFLNQPTRVVG